MKRILVVYYSLTGNTKFIAEHISNALNADIEEVKPIKELNPESGSKYFWGGMKAKMKTKPKLNDLIHNPLEYDLIIIGTPVWAWTLSPPIRSYCSEFELKDKNVALWTCSGGDGIKAMKRFKDFMEGSNIISELRFQEPLTQNPEQAKEQTIAWTKDIMNKLEQ
ncbi:MAG: flavodoxin family protein [Candidatus Odinarchaeota archaeon]